MRIVRLSHPLDTDTPLYPGTPAPEFSSFKSIERGDSANSTNVSINVHSGTHIDLPLHFCVNGASLSDFFEGEYELYPAYCIEIEKDGYLPLEPNDFAETEEEIRDARAILVKTGSGDCRGRNERFERDHPWVHPSLPGYLKETFPGLKLFGLDTISISSPNHREEGREAHRNFLCGERPVILLEDADFSGVSGDDGAFRLIIYPYFNEKIDASPVTVIAVIGNE